MSKQWLDRSIYLDNIWIYLCGVNGIGNGCIYVTMIKMRWTWHFQSLDSITSGTAIKQCSVHHPWQHFFHYGRDGNKVWHDPFSHVMLLAHVWTSYNTDGIVDGSILFARSRWSKQGAALYFGHDNDGNINSTIAFDSSIWSKWDTNWLFQQLDTRHLHQHQVMLMVLSIAPLYSLGQGDWPWCQCCVMLSVSSVEQSNLLYGDNQNEVQCWHFFLASHDANGISEMTPLHFLGQDHGLKNRRPITHMAATTGSSIRRLCSGKTDSQQ